MRVNLAIAQWVRCLLVHGVEMNRRSTATKLGCASLKAWRFASAALIALAGCSSGSATSANQFGANAGGSTSGGGQGLVDMGGAQADADAFVEGTGSTEAAADAAFLGAGPDAGADDARAATMGPALPPGPDASGPDPRSGVAASGPLTPWPSGPAPAAGLTNQSLTYAPSPLDNPLKGFLPWFYSKTDYANAYPHSMEWSYFALSEVMSGPTTFTWDIVDQFLDEVASRGNQGTVRFYVEYPGGTGTHPGNGIPTYLNGLVPMRTNTYWGTTCPDYDNPNIITAFLNFIQAFAARYDGDPRLGYITMGLVGLWGEWHTWPCDGQNPTLCSADLFPTDATVNTIADAYTAAFTRTPLLIRYAMLGGGHVVDMNTGFHDDSFGYKEFRTGVSTPMGDTLPVSLGGWPDSFLQKALNAHGENRWVTESIGGEARPEIQSQMFASYPGGSGQVDDMLACIELSHVTWLLNQQGVTGYSPSDPKVAAAVRRMGYELFVSNAYVPGPTSTAKSATLTVRIENRGVAPFPVPWRVLVAALDSGGNPVRTWTTSWDLRLVMPTEVRAFPDWKVGPDPTYLPFGAQGQYFTFAIPAGDLQTGTYTLAMRAVSPLESLSEAQIRATGHIESWQTYSPPKALRFANAEQGADGWLTLGTLQVTP